MTNTRMWRISTLTSKGPKKDYFKLKNCVFEALMFSYKIPDMERRLLGYIVRWTFGLRASNWVVLDKKHVSEQLGLDERHLRRVLKRLLAKNAIRRRGRGVKGSPFEYGPQKFVQFWGYDLHGHSRPHLSPDDDDKPEYEVALNKGATYAPERATNKRASCAPESEQTFPGRFESNRGADSSQIGGQPVPLKTASQPSTGAGSRLGEKTYIKDMFKDPPTPKPQKAPETGPKPETPSRVGWGEQNTVSRDERIAMKIYAKIVNEYCSATGGSYKARQQCLKLVREHGGNAKALKRAFKEAWEQQQEVERRTGQVTRAPFRVLDLTARIIKRQRDQRRTQEPPPPFVGDDEEKERVAC